MSSIQSIERSTIANALGLTPDHPALGVLSLTLNGLSSIAVRGSSITIPIPAHLDRSDITGIFHGLPHIEVSGDRSKVTAKRAQGTLPESLKEITLPPVPSQDPARAASLGSEKSGLPISHTSRSPRALNRLTQSDQAAKLGAMRASIVADALGLSSWQFSNYSDVVCKLGDATKCEHRPTKNSRAAGFLHISVGSDWDAAGLLYSLGFRRVASTGGSVWAAMRYEKMCADTETKSNASLALTLNGCDITISLGEPLTESFGGSYYSPKGSIGAPEE